MKHKTELALGLAATRCVLGALGLVAPVLTQRLSLLAESDDTSVVVGWRFFGTRALALGSAYLTADGATRRHLDRAGLVLDTLDTTFLTVMALRAQLRPRTAGWLALITASAAAIGLANVTDPRHHVLEPRPDSERDARSRQGPR